MNIVELLKNKESSVTLIYYGKKDMSSGFQIQTIVDNYYNINEYYNNKVYKINSLDDYIDYIFIDTYSKLKEIVPILREDFKERVSVMIGKLSNIKKQYKKSDINNYIRNQYEIVLSKEKLKNYELRAYEIIEYTLNYIKDNYQYFKENNNIYEYIVENYAYKIFNNFKDYKDIFVKYGYKNRRFRRSSKDDKKT